MGGSSKTSDSQPATSIPILQASRFDHLMRFGNYRNPVPFHGNLSTKDTHSSKEPECVCSSIGCDQMASVKTSNGDIPVVERTYTVGLNFSQSQSCQTEYSCHVVGPCNLCNNDDNYRPTVKKMISSYTQTEDFRCDCGKPLLPKCLECNGNPYNQEKEESGSYYTGMKRSRGSHNLAAINKSALLLEALERTSRLSECSNKEETDSGIDAILYCDKDEDVIKEDNLSKKEVIENNCDSSFSDNYCERDKNKLCLNCENCSVNNDELLFRSISVSSFNRFVNKPQPSSGNDLKCDKTNPNIEKTPSRKGSFAGSIDKAIDFIRKPKLNRLMPIVDKIDKIVMERNEERKKESLKSVTTSPYINNSLNGNSSSNSASRLIEEFGEEPDEDFLYKDEDSGITYMTNTIQDPNFVSSSRKTFPGSRTKINIHLDKTEEHNIVVYEKGNVEEYVQKRVEVKHGEKHSFEEGEANCGSCKHFRWDDDLSDVIIETPKKACDGQCSNKMGMTKSYTTYGSFDHSAVPSVSEMDRFRWRLDSAASMVFHSRTGLPLTSSPAPLRRGKSCFDYDSSINSVSGIKSALYGVSIADLETESCGLSWSPGSSPGSPLHWAPPSPPLLPQQPPPPPLPVVAFSFPPTTVSSVNSSTPKIIYKRNKFRHGTSSGLLGSFEESVLNGRLEPAATVAGFTAEIGASGAFCPPHLKLPVTVFFYSLGENTTSAPYLGHINLGRRGYNVPRAGTIQVTLFNPHGTVVKMFVVMYDMTDMPVNSRTFLRQRTLCVPAVPSKGQTNPDPRTLRYLIHLRFLTSKSGKVYLHTDIRIIVSRKADMDTAHSLNSVLALQDGQVIPSLTSAESRKKKTVETGVFEKRTKRNYIDKNPRVIRIFGGGDSDSIKDIKSRINRSKGCFELASYCKQNGVYSNIENDHKYFDNEDKTKLNGHTPVHNNKENISNGTATSDITESRTRSGSLSKELSYELRSFTYGPDNPKYSPR